MNPKKLFPAWLFSQLGLVLALVVGILLFVFFRGIDLTVVSPKWKIPSGVEVLKKTFSFLIRSRNRTYEAETR